MEFQNGKIYTIRSHQTNKYYIGSTNQKTLSQRLGKHRYSYKEYLTNNIHYISSFEILKYSDYYIELLIAYPCNNKYELRRKEGELIRQFKSDVVNIQIAGRTHKEYNEDNHETILERHKQYRQDNHETIAERDRQYRLDNSEYIKERFKQYYINNKEHIAEHNKQYYEDNKTNLLEHIKQYRESHKEEKAEWDRQPIICECGLTINKSNKQRHMRTTKHINLLNQQLFINELNNYNF